MFIRECTVSPGHDGAFELKVSCEIEGTSFGCTAEMPYDAPFDELRVTNSSGGRATVTSRDLAQYLSSGYDFDRESGAYLAALEPNEPPRVAFTIRYSSAMGGGTINLYRYINWLTDLGIDVAVYSDDVPPAWTTLNARFICIDDDQQRYAAISEPIVIVFSILEVPLMLRHGDTRGKRIYHFCQGAEEFHYSTPKTGNLQYPIPIFDMLNALPVGRMVVSPHLEQYFTEKYRRQPVTIINGVNLETFAPITTKSPRPGSYTVLVSGNPEQPLKGISIVRQALALLASRHPDWALRLVNVCGEQSPNAEEQRPIEGISSEIQCGLSPQEMSELYHAADVYVNASWYEGFGLPSLEAMASGTPVIQADNHGLDGIVENGGNCLIVPPRDPEALAAAMEQLFTSPELYGRLVDGGITTSAKFSLRNQHDMLVTCFSAMTGKPLHKRLALPAGLTAKPLFSVLVPCYNQAHFLSAALDSLLAQTYAHWEAIVVNDGSTDATAHVMENYAARDPRIRCFHKQNGGVASALNRGILEAQGEWICWLSSDDLFLPEKLAMHRDIIAADPGLRFMQTNYLVLYEDSGTTTPAPITVSDFIPTQELQLARFFDINYFNGISIAIHRNVFSVVGVFNEEYRYGQDFDLWMRISSRFRSRFIDSATCITRIHAGQGTNLFSEAGIYDSSRAALDFLNHNRFEAIFPQLTLSQPEQVTPAIIAVLKTILNPEAFINCCGFGQALLDRLHEWFTNQAPATVRTFVIEGTKELIAKISPELSQVLLPAFADTAREFTYEKHDAYAQLKRCITLLEQNGNDQKVIAIRRYLDMIISTSSQVQQAAQETSNVESDLAVADRNHSQPSGPYFSVIVPTYNQARYLPEALDSLLAQSFPDWEAVVVNDGSTDDTAQVLELYSARDRRIRIFHQENGGVAAALNTGLRNARGEWICWLSSDDLFEPHKLATHRQAISENPCIRFFYSHFYYLNDATGKKTASGLWQPIPEPALQVCRFFVSPYIHGNSIAVHRSVFEKVGLLDGQNRCGQDFDMWLRISAQFESRFIDSRTCVTRFHEAQSGNAFPEAGFFDSARACTLFLNANAFPKIFPLLDLSILENAVQAVQETLNIAFDGNALMYKGSQSTALLERLREWLVLPENAALRNAITAGLRQACDSVTASNLPDSIKQAASNLLVEEGYIFAAHDFLAETALQAASLKNSGKQSEALSLERYLKGFSRSQSRKLLITIITPGTDLSGGVKVIFEYCNRLAKLGHIVNLVTMQGEYPDWFKLEPAIRFIKSDYDIARLVSDLPDADVVFATLWLTAYMVNGLPASKGRKFYLVQSYESATLATPEHADPTYTLPLRKIAVSSWLVRLMRERFSEEATLIRNAYDPAVFYSEPSQRLDFPSEEIRVGMLYYQEERKGGADGMAAFLLAREKYPNMKLILFGQRPADSAIYDEIYENISGDDVRRYYNSLDLFISTSWQEGFGLPGLEAMACGIPLITTDSGGIEDYALDGATALVVPPRDRGAIARALILLAGNQDLRDRLRQSALTKAGEFSWNASVTALEGVLLQATSELSATAVAPTSENKVILARSSAKKPLMLTVFSLDSKDHACGYYRIQSPLSALHGEVEPSWGVEIIENKFSMKPGTAESADMVVVQRFFPLPETADFLDFLCSLGKPITFEIDDLLTQLPSTNPHIDFGMRSAPHIYDFIRKCSAVTVSTEELKKHFSPYNDSIHVLPNLLDTDLWHKTSPSSSGPVVIGYAGTITHNTDLTLLEEVLDKIASSYGNRVSFTFMGCATERISRLPGFSYIEFETTFEAYARKLQEIPVDIMLIPLEDNPFNRCKSNIKWLEYSACGYAGIYADLPPYNTSVEHGRTGLLVGNNPQQWYEAISLLIENPDLRRSVSANARKEVLAHYSLSAKAYQWLDAYRSIIHNHTTKGAGKAAHEVTASKPVSIIIPLFNNVEFTRHCLEALTTSTPQHLHELILIDNGSSDGTSELINGLPSDIKVIRNAKNQGFAKACNQGAQAADGKYLLFLNNDTEPKPGWLEPLFNTAEQDTCISAVGSKLLFPDGTIQHAGVIIADDRMTPDPLVGKHIYYGFPADHPEANISRGYQALTAACLLVRRDAFEAVLGFDEGYWNGYEDVDLCFKLGLKGRKLIYQPASVVVHHESKSGSERFAKAAQNIQRLHDKWLGTIQPDVIIHPDSREEWREKEPSVATEAKPLVSIIIPAFNQADFTRKCLTALFSVTGGEIPYEVIVVDNASTDWTPEYLMSLEASIRVLTNDRNLGFAKACNQGAQAAKGRYLVFLNNDTIPKPEWLAALVQGAEGDGADLVGAKLLYPDGSVQHAGVCFADPGYGVHVFKGMPGDHPAVNRKRFMQCVTGACLLLARQLFLELGGFDEGFVNGYEDVDLCLRAQAAGKRILYNPQSVLIHFEETSTGRKEKDRQNAEHFSGRWRGRIRFDDRELYEAEGLLLPIGEAQADRLYALLGANGNAFFVYQNVLARYPEDAGALLNLGRACAATGRQNDAKLFLERLLELRPAHPAALRELALLAAGTIDSSASAA